ncbi:MAG TPA: GAF domain-containing protein, partial [Acidimicrobiales bacterium]|nr:GAF domain-containing protein [Acidimicrobiales bacterium]
MATLVAVLWVGAVAVALSLTGGNVSLVGLLAISPFIAAAFARPSRVALVGLLAVLVALAVPFTTHGYGGLNHTLRVVTTLAATGLAMWISQLRVERTVQLRTARWETKNERRRRVAAEMTQRMQAMARALNTAVDPVQVADAVFTALRDELQVDAATFALADTRGRLQTLRRFGYAPDEPVDEALAALRPEGPVLKENVPLFAGSRTELRKQRPDVHAALRTSRFRALAVIPLVVSDHTIGVVVVRWAGNRDLAEPDRGFLFAITGAAAQAVERARLTVTEFVNLERSQQLHHLSSALAAATTPRDVANAAVAASLAALEAEAAVVRVPVPGVRALSSLAGSGRPALLTRARVPLEWTAAGSCFVEGRTTVTTHTPASEDTGTKGGELVPGVVEELGEPVTVVNEPLTGSAGPLGVLSLAFVGRPEPSEPDLRFLSTLAGLTTQAFERAQVFEHERAARRDAEAGRERLALLSEVTRLLSSSLDPTTVIRRTISLVEGRLADACTVHVPGDGGLVRLDVHRPTTSLGGSGWSGPAEVPFGSSSPAAVAFRTGRTQLAHVDPFDPLDPVDRAERAAGEADAARALAVPLTTHNEVLGVMTFVHRPGRDFEVDDVSLATEVASRTAVALSNAARFQREHVVAEVLQRAVLPDSLPEVEGLQLDAEYRAGVAGTYAGGDWYDVFELGDDTVFFSVGDVMGKGAPAAALMGQVRSAIRAYAVAGLSPTEVLSSLDRLFDALIEDRV